MNCLSEKCELLCNELYGRYVIAREDIKPGEVLLCETPALLGPAWNTELCCINCYRESMTMCKLCRKAPLCLYCTSHDKFECDNFKSSCIPDNFLIDYIDAITPLRCLLLSKNEPKANVYEELLNMESHCDKRRGSEIWNSHEERIVKPLNDAGILAEHSVDADFMQKLCGILDVNTFEVRTTHFDEICQVRGLYLKAALLAHDCAANTFITVDIDKVLRIFSSKFIRAGEMVCTDYTDVLNGTALRRTHLLEGKYFLCTCRRCMDPTELGTHMSSLTCDKCKNYVLFDDNKKQWICCSCQAIISNVDGILEEANKDFYDTESDMILLQETINKYTNILNPNHYLVLKMKQSLAGLLKDSYNGKDIILQQMQLCSDILENLKKLQPGISRLRGIALYEQYNQLIRLSSINYGANGISAKEHLSNLLQAEQIAKESTDMLIYEPAEMPEGKLAKKAMSDLKNIRESIKEFAEIFDDQVLEID